MLGWKSIFRITPRSAGPVPPPWGDGLEYQPLASLLRPRRWEHVSCDELVYLLPSLTWDDDASREAKARFLRAIDEPSPIEAANGRLDPAIRLAIRLRLREAAGLSRGDALALPACNLGDAVIISLYSGINGAYALGEFDFAHESLASAAWIGQLMRGRSAAMPLCVADCLDELLGEPISTGTVNEVDAVSALIAWHVEQVYDIGGMAQHATRVRRDGHARAVQPRPFRFPNSPAFPRWNDDLHRFVNESTAALDQYD